MVTSPCNDCGDLSAALEWTAWAPCADETSVDTSVDTSADTSVDTSVDTSGRVVEGMLCRRRGNADMGFEEEGRCQKIFYFSLIGVEHI